MKKELIGNGAHWKVYRITTFKKKLNQSKIFKEPIKNQNLDNNINNYNLILASNLPTLSSFYKKTINGIEGIQAEDLNPINCNGYFVSPNTLRSAEDFASLILKFMQNNNEIIPDDYKNDIIDYLNHPEKITKDREKLIERKILLGAEKYVYENKISLISNFNSFLIKSKADMKRASADKIELFSDVFFFRVSDTTNEIDYKIADFDCIVSQRENNISQMNLIKGNMNYFETALSEFIEFFVKKTHKNQYISELKRVW